ncbi:hypothetical protein LIER_11679 [Lithospermum erythrorhizon]|uniref:Uncharacterized protein n=1 Tax=Lithospermum erythrorhizon TaxID=34254 RepID=A0AAV3PNY2_LITER
MSNKINDAKPASMVATLDREFRSRQRLVPKRGQIKRRIAAKALQTIASVISTVPSAIHSPRSSQKILTHGPCF